MKRYGVFALLLVVLALASCGAGGMKVDDHGGSGGKHAQHAERETKHGVAPGSQEKTGGMVGMDHGDMSGMDHGTMGMGSKGMAKQMVMENGKYSDERFIDAMVPHHQGAIEMAMVALKNAKHKEIIELSHNIISSQQAEIQKLKSIKQEEFGTSRLPMQMSPKQMKRMGIMMNPQELARRKPFDKAFIDAMIPIITRPID